jgi:carbonic anhydrase
MKTPFNYKNIHACDAVVLACIDFRFWKETMKFVEEELGIKSYDFPKLPGAAKAINECENEVDVPMKCIGVPCDLHRASKIVIINHADCGAYGGARQFNGDIEAEQRFHEGELKRAKEKIAKLYPDKKIILAYAKLVDGGGSIEFIRVK